jgi:hypothetical protein
MRYSEARALKRRLEPKAEPGLQAIANHLAELTENPDSLPVALAQATAEAQAWQGLGLLSGSSTITDIATALTLFCSQYGLSVTLDNCQWAALLRQELPGLTDEDTKWSCGLTEEIYGTIRAAALSSCNRPLRLSNRRAGLVKHS